MVDAKPLIAGLVILLALVGTTYYITNLEQTYYCEKANTISMCFKLSNPTNGISSRCYYNETLPTKYYSCTSGWKPIKDFPNIMNNLTITGNEIIEFSHDTQTDAEMSAFVKQDFNSKYGVVTITGTKTGKMAEYSLTKNTEYCLTNCRAEGRATLYQNGTLFDDIKYTNLTGKDTSIISSQYLLFDGYQDNYVNVPDTYKTVCGKIIIGTNKTECREEVATFKKVNQPIKKWKNYNGEIKPAGDYEWAVDGVKEAKQDVDFIPIRNNQEFPWASWTSSFNTGLVAYYKFDNNGTQDWVAGLNNGTNSMGITAVTPTYPGAPTTGLINGAMYFKKQEGWLNISNRAAPGGIAFTTQNMTLNGWMYMSEWNPTLEYILASDLCNGYGLVMYPNDLAFSKNCVGGGVDTTDTVPTGQWSMWTVVYDQSSDKVNFYINGVADSGGQKNFNLNFDNSDYGFGAAYTYSSGEPQFRFNGTMDEVGIWNRTLSSTEVTNLYNGGAGISYTNDFSRNILGIVTDSHHNIVSGAKIIILNASGQINATTTSNSSGGWNYTTDPTFYNYTIIGYNPSNVSQGGNAYPFISA